MHYSEAQNQYQAARVLKTAAYAPPPRAVKQKEELARLLATERLRRQSDPSTNQSPNSPRTNAGSSSATGFNDDEFDWTPPPESWTQAKWGDGEPRKSRITSEGAIVPMIRIRPRLVESTTHVPLVSLESGMYDFWHGCVASSHWWFISREGPAFGLCVLSLSIEGVSADSMCLGEISSDLA